MKLNTSLTSVSLAALLALAGCAELSSPHSGSGYDPYYSGYDDSYYHRREEERAREARREYERERDRLEDERERLEEERRRAERERQQEASRPPPSPPPPPSQPERCPSGFSPSENKCSKEERKRGCKDIRLPGGLGCVRR